MNNTSFDQYQKQNINSKNTKCSCCNCVTSFCYCSCQCNCHNEKIKTNNNYNNFDDLPNLNINELQMKSLKEYTSNNEQKFSKNILEHTKKTLNSSKSMYNIENKKINNYNNTYQSFSNQNNFNKFGDNYFNKTQNRNYIDITNSNKEINSKINLKYNTYSNHFKTQSNFNTLQKYYQLNNDSKNEKDIRKTKKSKIEFNKLLDDIKNYKNNFNNNNNLNIHEYDSLTQRKNNYNLTKNNPKFSSLNFQNNSNLSNNGDRKTFNEYKYKIKNYKSYFNNKIESDFGFNTEYGKSFRPFNFSNKSINMNEENLTDNISNKDINSLNNFSIESNFALINQNGGNKIDNEKKDEFILFNNRYTNRINTKSFELDINTNKSNNKMHNLNNTEPKEMKLNKNLETDNLNYKNLSSKTNIETQKDSQNELLESKDINGDKFILTFGTKGNNNDIKNIISNIKNRLNSQNNKSNNNIDNGKEISDEKINNIIIDYENLKKKYEPNRIFVGLENNIKNLNDKINKNNNNSNNNNKITKDFSISKFDINIQGKLNKNQNEYSSNYKNEINDLKIELKEAKSQIDELTKTVLSYKNEINSLKGQLNLSKKETINNSKIETINLMSTNNIDSNTNKKTKIGKNSFIIKIPESLIKKKLNQEERSRNTLSNEINNKSNIINQHTNDNNQSLLNLTNNTYRKLLCKNNLNNFNNISNISNDTNSNCITNNNISSNNISNYIPNNDIYVKKITTTMQKKFRKSASQKIRINKLNNNNLYKRHILKKNNSGLIYTILSKNDQIDLLSFDINKREFNLINFIDLDNFQNSFKESKNNKDDILTNKSIYLNNNKNNNFYIVTGKNSDELYKYEFKTNLMKKLCILKNNHSNGCLLFIDNKIICLSGNHNKKVEIYFEKNQTLFNLPEMNKERCYFSSCIIKNRYIFALFGYNFPSQQYLDSIEYYELNDFDSYKYNYIDIKEDEWKYLNYKDNNHLNLYIKGHLCFNYYDEKIIFFGGFNGNKNEAVDCFYQLILDENFNSDESNGNNYVELVGKKLNEIYKNRIYYFGNNTGMLFEDSKNNLSFAAMDNNCYIHMLDITNFKHNIYYFP